MKTAIIGSGGVGGYFGAKLLNAGYPVSFLARGKHLEAIKNNGLTIKSILGDFKVENVTATDMIEEIGPADLVILGVKAWQIKDIRNELEPLLHSRSVILPLQNGVLAVDELEEVIDKSHILGGLCRIFSKIESPGVINHMGMNPSIVFGEPGKTGSERTQKLKEVFDAAGIESRISADIEADIWKKFISICVGGLLAVTRTVYGELREIKETRQIMIGLLKENYALSQKIGVNIEPGYIDEAISAIDAFPYNSASSLTRDVWEGKPSEIYYQNGTVVMLGEKYGVETPINRFIFDCILPMELRARRLMPPA